MKKVAVHRTSQGTVIFILALLILTVKFILTIAKNQWTDYLKIPDFIRWYTPDAVTPPLYGEKIVRQDLSPHFDGLCELGLCFDWKQGPIDVIISLYEGKDERHLVFENGFSLDDIYKRKMFRFRFKPVKYSKDRYFTLFIKAPGLKVTNGLQLYYHRRSLHISCRGPLYFDNQNVAGELSLAANCRYDIGKGIFAWAKKKILSDKLFLLSYGIVLLAPLALAFIYRPSQVNNSL